MLVAAMLIFKLEPGASGSGTVENFRGANLQALSLIHIYWWFHVILDWKRYLREKSMTWDMKSAGWRMAESHLRGMRKLSAVPISFCARQNAC